MITINIIERIKNKGVKGMLKSTRNRLLCWDDKLWNVFIFNNLKVCEKWIFFQSEGDFSDNAKALYEYMKKNLDSSYKFIWLVENPELYPNLENTIFISSKPKLLIGQKKKWYYATRSKHLFFTHHGWYINKRPEQIIVNLWHGTAFKRRKGDFVHRNTFDYTLTTSDYYISTQSEFLGCNPSKVKSLGFPRNDLLFKELNSFRLDKIGISKEYKKLIVWMPTFRTSYSKDISEDYFKSLTGLPLIKNKNDLEDLDNYLHKLDVKVIVKLHHLQKSTKESNVEYRNIIFLEDSELNRQGIQLYEILASSDALLTDYSSVFIDYLLKDKPIGFVLDDYDEYIESRGLMFENMLDMMTGDHIRSKDELFNFINNIAEEIDGFKEDRIRMLKRSHKFIDDNAAKRVTEFVLSNNDGQNEFS